MKRRSRVDDESHVEIPRYIYLFICFRATCPIYVIRHDGSLVTGSILRSSKACPAATHTHPEYIKITVHRFFGEFRYRRHRSTSSVDLFDRIECLFSLIWAWCKCSCGQMWGTAL